ncbi:MAG: ATP-binding cassette subfamily B multidrug efflux pump [Urechidicola sp.]|mgnify:CR=1 FL=1|jgi:ATP-binding cassette subfamily B protein|tara:strand:- start:71 stop:1840 length:1770 start_codon:yes stop_codon:yes gene_type:complete
MKSLSYLNKYLVKYKWRLILGVVFITASNFFGVEMPRIVKKAVDLFGKKIEELKTTSITDIDKSDILEGAFYLALIYVGLSLCRGVFVFLNRQTIIIMSRLIEYDLKNEIYSHYQKLTPAFYKNNNTGDLMNRISEDVSKVRMYLGPAIMYSINLVVLSVLTIYYMVSVNLELTLYALAPLPIMTIMIYYISRVMNQRSEEVQRQQSIVSTFVQESFSGIRVVKAYNMQKSLSKSFLKEVDSYKSKSMNLATINAFFFPVIVLLIGASTVLTIYIGGIKANAGEITNGDIAAFVIYVNMLTWPFASIGWVTSMVQRAAASQTRINEFLKQEPEIFSKENAVAMKGGDIVFNNASFVYPDSGIKALQNVSFTLSEGKTLGIIGETGSGKSTIANMIARLYEVTSGEVKLGGNNITDINLAQLRQAIGYVPQDSFLFSNSIGNNIKFGLSELDESSGKKMEQAARDAHIYDNIIDFENGFDTIVGERGITLSGGQKQRVSIARAIIKHPDILIFDDCLSALDTETEAIILRNLKRIMEGKTSVIISHRISSLEHADLILVMNEGKVIEQGTHEELLAEDGYYASLNSKQKI